MVIGIDASRAYIGDKTGTENYSYCLINALLRLPESRVHQFVLFTRPNAILPQELAGYSQVTVKVIKPRYLWTQIGLAWKTWGKHKLDVLWVPAHTLPVLRNPKIQTVVTIHGLEYQWLPEYKNWLQRWYLPLSTFYAAKYADRLIAVSQFTANQLIEQLHTNKNKIKVIHEGTTSSRAESRDPSTMASLGARQVGMTMKRYGLQSKKYILFVGSIQPRKNLVALIEAFSLVAKDLPDLKLVIAGGVGWLAEEVLRAPSRFGVQEKVVFSGRVSDLELKALYLGALIYVQPSITEGFGLPVLEAMASGVPVISSDGGALKEVVGSAGLVVQLNNQVPNSNNQKNEEFPKRLAEAMKQLAKDKIRQKILVAMGYERSKEWSWDRTAKETLKVIAGEGYNSHSLNNQSSKNKSQV